MISSKDRLEVRLAKYGAMAAAIAAGAAVPAEAAVVVWPGNGAKTSGYGTAVYFNPMNGSVSSNAFTSAQFRLQRTNTFNSTTSLSAKGYTQSAQIVGSSFNALRMFPSDSVTANLNFYSNVSLGTYYTSSSNSSGPFQRGTTGYIGLRFEDSGGDPFYGWAKIMVDQSYDINLLSFAWDDQGLPIHIPNESVPEPHSAFLMALGAAGLAAYRRRNKAE